MPGAFLISPTDDFQDDSTIPLEYNNDHNNDHNMYAAADVPTIVAHLAPDEDDIRAMYQEQLETEVRMRLTLVTNDATIFVADEVTKEDSPIQCSLKKGTTRWIMALVVFVVIGGGLGGVVYWTLPGDETQGGILNEQQELDPIVVELRSLIAPNDNDLLPFMDPESPQSQAVAWLRDDPITLTPGRSTETVLERYVVAVLYYTTAGQEWTQFQLSDSDHCTWNKALEVYGEVVHNGILCTEEDVVGMIETLHLGGNNLFGSTTWEVVLLTHLKSIILQENVLTGTIPIRITELARLERFWAWSNRLTGTMPALFSPNMLDINLSKNQFTGTLPETWGSEMPLLQGIQAYENSLTGTLPTSLGLLSNLVLFVTFRNFMSGTLPTELGQLRALEAVYLQMNSFTGSMNNTLCSLPGVAALEADCGEVECPCCTSCCSSDMWEDCVEMSP